VPQPLGVNEAHLWGKAELEDMLFQPKNGHLLFACLAFHSQFGSGGCKRPCDTLGGSKGIVQSLICP
jgi:hypothetical protein